MNNERQFQNTTPNELDKEYEDIQKIFAARDQRIVAQKRYKYHQQAAPKLKISETSRKTPETIKRTNQYRGRRVMEAEKSSNLKAAILKIAVPMIIISGILFTVPIIADFDNDNNKGQKPLQNIQTQPAFTQNYSLPPDTDSEMPNIDIETEAITPELEFSEQNISAEEVCSNIQELLDNEDYHLEGNDCKQKLTYLYKKLGFSKTQTAALLANNLIENPSLNPFQHEINQDNGIGIFMESNINRYGKKGESYPGYQYPAEYDGLLVYIDKEFPELTKYFSDSAYSFDTHAENSLENSTKILNQSPEMEDAINKALIAEVSFCFNIKYSHSNYERNNISSAINHNDITPGDLASAFCLKVERPYSNDTTSRATLAEDLYRDLN